MEPQNLTEPSESTDCCNPGGLGVHRSATHPYPPSGTDSRGEHASGALVELTGGDFVMGSDAPHAHAADGESPTRRARVAPFRLGEAAVTNGEFAAFVADAGYVTTAEIEGGSFVFHMFVPPGGSRSDRLPAAPWWIWVRGAQWDSPHGPPSSVADSPDHPVVHVSLDDAEAYCAWAGGRLPTEEEWELAARGGLQGRDFPWGDALQPNGEHRANVWQGRFPVTNTAADGYIGTAPAKSYIPNAYGLYNMVGNVWEWTGSLFLAEHVDTSVHPAATQLEVMRGGSYLCHDSYCNRYRVSARSGAPRLATAGNVGFRLAADISPGRS